MITKDNRFTISHEFDAPAEKVFEAWIDLEQLKAWFAPKDYSLIFAKSDIKPGGVSHYCMVSEHGLELWSKLFYKDIIPPAKLSYTQCYSNEAGEIQKHPMILDWPLEILTTVMLDEKDGKTTLDLSWEPMNASQKEVTKFTDGFFEISHEWGGLFDQLSKYLSSN